MPAMKHYVVSETRTVKVIANNAVDAIRLAAAAFEHGQNSDKGAKNGPEGVWGNTTSKVEQTNIEVNEERY